MNRAAFLVNCINTQNFRVCIGCTLSAPCNAGRGMLWTKKNQFTSISGFAAIGRLDCFSGRQKPSQWNLIIQISSGGLFLLSLQFTSCRHSHLRDVILTVISLIGGLQIDGAKWPSHFDTVFFYIFHKCPNCR